MVHKIPSTNYTHSVNVRTPEEVKAITSRVTSPRVVQAVRGAHRRVPVADNGRGLFGVAKVRLQVQASSFPFHFQLQMRPSREPRVGKVAHVPWPGPVSETLRC
ncbi:hypothetical protein E2542_SST02057 [Spatholobus suberectus]|nr:hypothetical protein E2542_SST02057 [Spatholobus suberectus]